MKDIALTSQQLTDFPISTNISSRGRPRCMGEGTKILWGGPDIFRATIIWIKLTIFKVTYSINYRMFALQTITANL